MEVRPEDIRAIIVEDPAWSPARLIHVRTGNLLSWDGTFSEHGLVEETRPEWQWPRLWIPQLRIVWNRSTQQLTTVDGASLLPG